MSSIIYKIFSFSSFLFGVPFSSNSENVYTGKTPKDVIPADEGAKPGDIFIADGTDTGYYKHAGRAYRYTGSSWVAISAGVIAGTKLSVDTIKGKIDINATSEINIASGKNLELTADGTLTIAGAEGVKIGSGGKLTIVSGGKLFVDSTNFKVNPDATNTNSIFYVGDKNETKYLKYSATNGLEVKGQIDATSGSIGGWTIGSNFLGSGDSDLTSAIGMRNASSSTSAVFWAGHDVTKSDFNDSPFRVTRNGTLYASKGKIGGWNIGVDTNKSLYYGSEIPGTDNALVLSPGIISDNSIAGSAKNLTWMITAGKNFGVTTNGNLYATNAVLKGSIYSISNNSKALVNANGIYFSNKKYVTHLTPTGLKISYNSTSTITDDSDIEIEDGSEIDITPLKLEITENDSKIIFTIKLRNYTIFQSTCTKNSSMGLEKVITKIYSYNDI